MTAGLFPGQGIPARTVLDALRSDDPLLASASDTLGYDLRRRVEIAARRKGVTLPTSLAQPAIFVASMMSFTARWQPSYDCFCGHSLGEYAALVAAGSLDFAAALGCVAVRAEAMQAASRTAHGGMAAVLGLELDAVEHIAAATGVEVANDNSPEQTVVAGPEDALGKAAAEVRAQGGRSVLLEVSGPFHTEAMAPAAGALEVALERVEIRAPRVPVVANVTALPYAGPSDIARSLVEQLSRRVRFRESLEWIWDQGTREFDDLGPGRVAAGLARRTFDDLESRRGVTAHA
jgi:malonyl CoA-acyl carrier protein transacylase